VWLHYGLAYFARHVRRETRVAQRGFFQELNRQAKIADQRKRQQYAAQERSRVAAQREYERAQKAAARAAHAVTMASLAEMKAAEKNAQDLHIAMREAEAAEMNANLSTIYSEVDGILSATLAVDDWVDLETLRVNKVDHPLVELGELEHEIQEIPVQVYVPEPVWQEPEALRGLGAFLGAKKHAVAIELAMSQYELDVEACLEANRKIDIEYEKLTKQRDAQEYERLQKLVIARMKYEIECGQREQDAQESNAELDKLINDLAFDVKEAIEQYVEIVLSNSVYPESFPTKHEYAFDLESRELTLSLDVGGPESIPTAKEFKFVRAVDEITSSSLPVTVIKNRYNNAIWQVAIRTFHEIFESDRNARIHTIALTVRTDSINKATGLPDQVPLVVASADRETFSTFDLSKVDPLATLKLLAAALSKNPFELHPADTARGVRSRG
jgi:restriction system protein